MNTEATYTYIFGVCPKVSLVNTMQYRYKWIFQLIQQPWANIRKLRNDSENISNNN